MDKQKVKLFHEQEYETYGINTNEMFKNTDALKPLPKEWITQIIEKSINVTYPNPININKNINDKVFTLSFNTQADCEKFYNEFNKNVMPCINQFITNMNENPSVYNRMLVLETSISGVSITIRY